MVKCAAFSLFFVTAALSVVGNAVKLETTPCESVNATGVLHSVALEPCASFPCKLQLTKRYSLDIIFTPRTSCRDVIISWVVKTGILPFQGGGSVCSSVLHYPGGQPGCPIVDGNKTLIVKFVETVPAALPIFKYTGEVRLMCDRKEDVILCFKSEFESIPGLLGLIGL